MRASRGSNDSSVNAPGCRRWPARWPSRRSAPRSRTGTPCTAQTRPKRPQRRRSARTTSRSSCSCSCTPRGGFGRPDRARSTRRAAERRARSSRVVLIGRSRRIIIVFECIRWMLDGGGHEHGGNEMRKPGTRCWVGGKSTGGIWGGTLGVDTRQRGTGPVVSTATDRRWRFFSWGDLRGTTRGAVEHVAPDHAPGRVLLHVDVLSLGTLGPNMLFDRTL